MYVIDTSIWIEYLAGSEKGKKIQSIIEHEVLRTSIIAIVEIADKCVREGAEPEELIAFIRSKAAIVPVTTDIAVRAAHIKKAQRQRHAKFSIADALHLATAEQQKAIFLTADRDFEGMKNVMLI